MNGPPPRVFGFVLSDRFWLLLFPVAVLLLPLLFGSRLLAFRDGGHFYFPLLTWLDSQQRGGVFPLWNPYDGVGAPVAGDSTAALFYPGRLVFLLPGSPVYRYHVYVALHLVGCFAGSMWLARRWGCSLPASLLAGLAYAFSGSVLFQVFNVIFLAGASWLPLALAGIWELLKGRWLPGLKLLAPAMAMMILSGDPQMAVHTVLAAGVFSWTIATESWKTRLRQQLQLAAILAGAIAATCLLAAAQLVPTIDATRDSERVFLDKPRTLWQAAKFLDSPERRRIALAGLFGPTQDGTFDHSVYEFSVPPWRVVEFVWPNASGDFYPTSRRWLNAIDGEGRVWVPNHFCGWLPFVLLGVFWWHHYVNGADAEQPSRFPWRGLLWLALFAWLASLGSYAPAAFVKKVSSLLGGGDLPWLGSHVGSVVWLLGLFVPGYSSFRYPAKWLVVAALPMAIVAARSWDTLDARRVITLRRAAIGIAILSLVALLPLWATHNSVWNPWASQLPDDTTFGPFDVERSYTAIVRTLLHAGTVAVLFGWLFSRMKDRARLPESSGWIAVAITAVELAIAHHNSIPTTPIEFLQPPTILAQQVSASEALPARIQRAVDVSTLPPERWKRQITLTRLDELAAWEWSGVTGKTHLAMPVGCLDAQQTLPRADLAALLREYRTTTMARGGIGPLGAEYLLASNRMPAPADSPWKPIPNDELSDLGDATLYRRHDPVPRTWIARTVVVRPQQRPATAGELRRITRETVQAQTTDNGKPSSQWRDLVAAPIVETNESLAHGMNTLPWSPDGPDETLLPREGESAPLPETDTAVVVSYGPHEVVIDAELPVAGLLVLSDAFDRHWTAERTTLRGRNDSESDTRPVLCSIVRTNRVMRGVPLPAGTHRVVFRYRPRPTYFAIAVSIASWLGLMAVFLRTFYGRN